MRIFSVLAFILFLSLIISSTGLAVEDNEVVDINNVRVELTDKDGMEFVSLRELAGKLGYSLGYLADSKTVTLKKDITARLSLIDGVFNGESKINGQLQIIEGRAMLDIEAATQLLNYLGESPVLLTSLAVDKEKETALLQVYNLSTETIYLRFGSGQRYDLVLMRDEKEIWRWSDGRFFTMALVKKELKPGGGLQYSVELPLHDLSPANYFLEAFLKTIDSDIIIGEENVVIE